MDENRINLINKIVSESFGEGFSANLDIKIKYPAYASMQVTSYEFGQDYARYIAKITKRISRLFPFCLVKIRGKFAEPDGSKLIVPRKYIQNAEKYADLYKKNDLGENVEIKIGKGISKSTIITDFTDLEYPGQYPAHPLFHP